MGNSNTKPFTEQGVKQIYLSLLLVIPFGIFTFLTAFTVLVIFGTTFAICIIILLIIFLKGIGNMLSGREELGEKHTWNVVIATILSSAAFIVFLFLIVLLIISTSPLLSVGINFLSDAFSSYYLSILLMSILFVAFRILIGLGLNFYIEEIIPEKKQLLWKTFFVFVFAPFVLLIPIDIIQVTCALGLITFIIPVLLYLLCYRIAYQKLCYINIKKATPLIPCPFCGSMIPIDSTSCKHCGTEFEENPDTEIDPRLKMDVTKPEYMAPRGYTPTKGPTEEQKKKLFLIIGIIIVIIIVVSILLLLFR